MPGAQITNEDTTLVFNVANSNLISISDTDAGTNPLEVTLTVNDGILTLSGTTGLIFNTGSNGSATMTFTGTLSDINTALDGLSFTPNTNFNGSASLQITTHDDTSLLASYSFDNIGNLGADDGPGITYDGTVNGATQVFDATRGDVLNFDGNDSVQITGHFGDPANLTLSAWVDLTTADTNGADFISLGDSVVLRYGEWSGGSVRGAYYDGSTWQELSFTTNLVGAGWHHVAYSVDDTNNVHTIYLDGVAVDSNVMTGSVSYTLGPDSYIGTHGDGAPQWDLIGQLDDARVYDRVLTAAEIAGIMNVSPGKDSDTINITVDPVNDQPTTSGIANYSINEDSGFSFLDLKAVFADVEDPDTSLTFSITGNTNPALFDSLSITGADLDTLSSAYAANQNGSSTITIRATDTGGEFVETSYTVTVNAVNDAPVNIVPLSQTTDEDTTIVFSAGNGNHIQVGDVDSGNNPLKVTLTATNGTMTLSSTFGLNVSVGTGSDDTTVTFTGTITNINAALEGMSFTPLLNYNGSANIQITTEDLGSELFGYDTVFASSTTAGVNDKEQIATQVTLSQDGTLTSITAYMGGIAEKKDIQFSLYADAAGEPGALLAESGKVTYALGDGWFTVELPATALTAGNYWLGLAPGKEATLNYDAAGGQTRYSNFDPGSGFADPWSGTYATNTQQLSVFASYTPDGVTAGSDIDNISINVNSVNDAPTLDNTGTMTFNPITEDISTPANSGNTVAEIIASAGDMITDPDSGAVEGIAVTGVDNSSGTWYFTTDELSWWSFEFRGVSTSGASDANAVLLDSTAKIRFVPYADYNGSAGNITFRAWDQTTGTNGQFNVNVSSYGGTTAFSAATETASINVTAVNDAPTVANAIANQSAAEDTPFNFQFATNTFNDVDADTLTYISDASGWLAFNATTRTFTGTPLNGDVGTTTVTVTADDGNGGSISDTFDIVVNNTIDAPVAVDDKQSLDFDGIDDYVSIANSPSLIMTNTMTMEAWINPDTSANSNRMIINKEGEYEVALLANDRLVVAFANTDPGWTWHDTGYTVTNGEWVHIAVSYNNGTMSTYVNGSVVDVYSGSGSITDAHVTMNDLRIGGRENVPAGKYFDGEISDVRIWNTVRTDAEIAAAMGQVLTGAEAGLVGYWQFNESTGAAVTDLTVNANHGTLIDGGSGTVGPQWTGYVTDQDTQITINAANGILDNDYDPDGDTLTVTQVNGSGANVGGLFTLASGANLTVGSSGDFIYDPNAAFDYLGAGESGTDTFTYQVTDGNGGFDTATVIIKISGINDAPTHGAGNIAAIFEDNTNPPGETVANLFNGTFC